MTAQGDADRLSARLPCFRRSPWQFLLRAPDRQGTADSHCRPAEKASNRPDRAEGEIPVRWLPGPLRHRIGHSSGVSPDFLALSDAYQLANLALT